MPKINELTEIVGVRKILLDARGDDRGRFVETWRAEWVPDSRPMVQGNRSRSGAGVLRAFHYHRKQADYWYMGDAHVFVALVDLRADSPTSGAVWTATIEEDDEAGLYIPHGVAHGFCALGPTILSYLVDEYYDGSDEHGIAWDDPDIGVRWPVAEPTLSARDQSNPHWRDVPPSERP